MNKILLPALTALVCAAPASFAQNFASLDQKFDVRGELRLPSGEREIREIKVELERDGRAKLDFRSKSGSLWNRSAEFSGRWYGDSRAVTIDLSRGLDQNASGQARIRFDSNFRGFGEARIESLSINGRIGNNPWNAPEFRGQFDIKGDGDADFRGGINDLYASKRGDGTLKLDNERDDDDLQSAKVELNRDGTAKITVEGRQTYFYEGIWRQRDASRLEILLETSTSVQSRRRPGTATHAIEDGIGRGEIILDGGTFRSITLRGRRGDQGFELNFNAQNRGSRDDWRGRWRNGDNDDRDNNSRDNNSRWGWRRGN